jgi:hypothetical protein
MRILFALAAAAALTACTHPVDTADAPSFGASVAAMHEAQTVNTTVTPGAPESSAAVGALAQERYHSGATRPLAPSSTSLANPGQ